MILPGQTLGLLGGGAIARLLAMAAQTLGYRVHVFAPPDAPFSAGAADRTVTGAYDDLRALKEFAREIDVAIVTFENIPIDSLRAIAAAVPLHPSVDLLQITQQRQREKAWLRAN